ncbi:acyl-[acyl-carrier-protein] thioesterase [Rhodococcus sp. BP-252]|uniref:acyl-[acyl-carrier-protein] thioesterase n=1 Tax=unclassified Rhodococcus (in: high G+C Gram-positive bacteria) TaxID=192944 RepID=UPI001C9AEFDA|nr:MULTISPECIES: acyl-ACP thioesterase domain-containing protein [unclassified Rhodococcus (in: high G+C Gram-positive bacteria)]MBY6410188.1 acyl-[acyl-carrier-protein] thioesterase [Rhodococcus sp. BP-320]MBY6415157.1 acyl-[acyl-carrier-protein] thioesterase [Rhodococcus sp. BP-321]MBY6421480.1 acyl-[acyl-carrier-protein] thioesterase [Rhodococcus sp. BP-324]MBY6425535.1 acyl-[acyl-carrier-protein] thioesterase [Rhodococcus sp. BP-323]MBY6430053.1 acyl-[acyl-carrier-protein] thioesterase [Rh
MPLPALGPDTPAFERTWTVRLGDTDTKDRLRLDAVARYLQDIAFDHLDVSDDGHLHGAWIVRRTVVDVLRPIVFRENVTLRRWSSGLSNRWCNIRVQIVGDRGGLVETEAFFIHIDPTTGGPSRMTDRFMAPMLEQTTVHRLRWKAHLSPFDGSRETRRTAFPTRSTDFDRLGHVNNAIYWQPVEDELAGDPAFVERPHRAIVEHVGAVLQGDDVTVQSYRDGDTLYMQIETEKATSALVRVEPLVTANV